MFRVHLRPEPRSPPRLGIMCRTILRPGSPAQWLRTTAEPNAGLVPKNAPTAKNPHHGGVNPVNDPDTAKSEPVPRINVPATSKRITWRAEKAAHPTNTHCTPAQITYPAGNRPIQFGPANQMTLFRILAQIAHGAILRNSSVQS